jgi:hypothetical protein
VSCPQILRPTSASSHIATQITRGNIVTCAVSQRLTNRTSQGAVSFRPILTVVRRLLHRLYMPSLSLSGWFLHYSTNVMSHVEGLRIVGKQEEGGARKHQRSLQEGNPNYTTSREKRRPGAIIKQTRRTMYQAIHGRRTYRVAIQYTMIRGCGCFWLLRWRPVGSRISDRRATTPQPHFR